MTKPRKPAEDEPLAAPARGSERKAVLLRLSPELHAELRSWAARDLRSLNAQVEFLLRDAVNRRRKRKD